MLLTISTTHDPATDLGYLLHKHPERSQSFELPFGTAHVFYPEATDECCTAALLVDVDPVGLVRRGRDAGLQHYVNDRPYAASSFLSVAISHVYGTALAGKCDARPTLVNTALPLVVQLAAVPARAGENAIRRIFEPLGYDVQMRGRPLDERFPEWGLSPYVALDMSNTLPLKELLAHLYVLIPVLDNAKHYWVGDAEVEKLLRHGKGWLEHHPERDFITQRYLKRRRDLVDDALSRLAPRESIVQSVDPPLPGMSEPVERLHDRRLDAVVAALKQSGARTVLDLGCGEGQLIELLLADSSFDKILGVDVSHRALERAQRNLRLERRLEQDRQRVQLLHGTLTYRDKRLAGYDAAAIVEVIEHLDPERIKAFERVVFEFARPKSVVLTTPNADYNVRFTDLPAEQLRHRDHRFEWSRQEFAAWCRHVAERFGYAFRTLPVGEEDPRAGAPSQMAIFTLEAARIEAR